jgi:hypothetical protein
MSDFDVDEFLLALDGEEESADGVDKVFADLEALKPSNQVPDRGCWEAPGTVGR